MKRLALLLWILASIYPFSASAAANSSDTRLPLIVWHSLDHRVTTWLKSAWNEANRGKHTKLKVYEDVDFETAFYPDQDEGAAERPDALILSNDLIGLHRNFVLSEIPSTLLRGIKSRFVNTVRTDDRYYGVPLFVSDVLLLYFNKRIVSKPIQDLDHLAALRTKDAEFTPIIWPYKAPTYFAPFLLARDAWPRGSLPIRLDTPQFAQALQSYETLAHSDVIDPDCDAACASGMFLSEKAPYAVAGLSFLTAARKALGKDLGVAPLPEVHKIPLRPVYGTYSLAFPLRSLDGRKREGLLRLARALTGGEAQRRLLKETVRIPVNATAFAGATRHASAELKVALQQTRNAIPIPSGLEMSAYWSALGEVLGMVAENDRDTSSGKVGELAQRLYESYRSRLKERR